MILNLAYPNKSDLKYKYIEFSDSHTHIKFESLEADLKKAEHITIKTRLSSLNDVFVLLQATDAIRSIRSGIHIDLVVTYLICGRYDRPMYEGDSFDLKIIADLLVQRKYDHITIYEPHSDISTALLDAKAVHPLDSYLTTFITNTYCEDGVYKDVCIVVPDLGAVKRAENFAKSLGKDIPIVYVHKKRDILTGEIKGVTILNPENLQKNIVIYDDLCDGGRTFIELARAIRMINPDCIITLAITHGIFSKGFNPILEVIDRIVTTNSFRHFVPEIELKDVPVTVVNVI